MRISDWSSDVCSSDLKIVSSLVFHQCPMEIKQAIAAQMHRLLRPGGQLFIADYGEQRSPLMRMLFRQIQWPDGVEYTEPNARGCMPDTLAAAGFDAVEQANVIATPTGGSEERRVGKEGCSKC